MEQGLFTNSYSAVNEIPCFHGTWTCTTVFTKAYQWTYSEPTEHSPPLH